jgi:hypothetical protein
VTTEHFVDYEPLMSDVEAAKFLGDTPVKISSRISSGFVAPCGANYSGRLLRGCRSPLEAFLVPRSAMTKPARWCALGNSQSIEPSPSVGLNRLVSSSLRLRGRQRMIAAGVQKPPRTRPLAEVTPA